MYCILEGTLAKWKHNEKAFRNPNFQTRLFPFSSRQEIKSDSEFPFIYLIIHSLNCFHFPTVRSEVIWDREQSLFV